MKIEIVNVTKGVWRFYVVAGNGRTVCQSVDYLSRRNARDGAKTLVEKAGDAEIVGWQ